MIHSLKTIDSIAANFSTDPTAYSVKRSISARLAMIGRPRLDERQSVAVGPETLEDLYPSLFAQRPSLGRRFADCLRLVAAAFGNRPLPHETPA
jgi:hypothetical protein